MTHSERMMERPEEILIAVFDLYYITEKGREALQQIFTWVRDIQKYKDMGLMWKEAKL